MICPNCNEVMIWNNSFSYNEYGVLGNGSVEVYVCPHCGIVEELYNKEMNHHE